MCHIHDARPVRSYDTILGRYVRKCPECVAETHARLTENPN